MTTHTYRVEPYWCAGGCALYTGDALGVLRELPDGLARCCVTSPPYWGLRDYGVDGQLGLEATPEAYIASMVAVFREVRRVLADDGTLWLNIGDSYNAYNGNAGPSSGFSSGSAQDTERPKLESGHGLRTKDLKPKDLVGIPWLLAFALRADGWYLRQDIIWHKPNPMPESVRDRCTKAHEYLFLLSKSQRYYYDAEAIAEPVTESTIERLSQPGLDQQEGSHRAHAGGKTNGTMKAVVKRSGNKARKPATARDCPRDGVAGSVPWEGTTRNRRSVWTVTTQPYPEAHFATYPPKLIEPCILAGSAPGDTVLDPFTGSGTTGAVAAKHGRRFVGIELNQEYAELARKRIGPETQHLFAETDRA